MAIRIRSLIPCCLVIWAVSFPLFGQEKPEIPLREFTFSVASTSRIRNVRFGEYNKQGQIVKSHPTGFKSSGRSLTYSYKGPNPIVFFEEEPAPSAANPNNMRRTPVASVNLPEEFKDGLFLFLKNSDYPDSAQKYNIQWIDLDPEKIPAGYITIYNTLPINFKGAAKVDSKSEKDKILSLKPGLNEPFSIFPRASVLLALRSKEGQILRVYENTIECDLKERVLLIIFPPRFPGSHRVGSKIITLPYEKEQAAEKETDEDSLP